MTKPPEKSKVVRKLRCAIYTRKSSEEGLEQEFNSLHAQREACEAFIASQRSEGWVLVRDQYDDGGISGGTLERPGLKRLLQDIEDGLVDVVVVYKIDRLSRSLADFAKLVEVFDRNGVTFVSVTQSFNTTTSMGRLTLNILLSFAQFEREVTLGRKDTTEAVLTRDLRGALHRLNPDLPEPAIEDAIRALTVYDVSRSMVQHNRDFYRMLRGGVPVTYRDAQGRQKSARARVIDFDNAPGANRFLAVRELKLTGIRTPNYNRRADLVCFVNGLPLVFIELKAVYKNIRAGFDGNLRDYMDENVIAHAFHHNTFLIVSNGDRARYGSITSAWEHFNEWKRLEEADEGSVDAERLLNGMLAHDRLLDLVENFILFDESKAGAARKVVARNHQVLGVNRAVASVARQEAIKADIPPGERLRHRVVELPLERKAPTKRRKGEQALVTAKTALPSFIPEGPVDIIERAHPDLGRLGVFWHTQGSGKSYSMAFFAEKVRRKVPGNFTFLLMTDRNDLDSQIYKTFVGCGIAGNDTPRAASGDDLERILKENNQYVFSLIHKFNKDVDPKRPYSERDDIIVISDEAHRTQAGRLARNMRLALPNAAFIGFTGTPLFKQDEITKRIFGEYVSRYDFKRSEEDGG